jgi:hypothetical protein
VSFDHTLRGYLQQIDAAEFLLENRRHLPAVTRAQIDAVLVAIEQFTLEHADTAPADRLRAMAALRGKASVLKSRLYRHNMPPSADAPDGPSNNAS